MIALPGAGTALLPTSAGHIGCAVAPWRQRRGYATAALRAFLALVRETVLPWVEVSVDAANPPSRRVIEKNGGEFVAAFEMPAMFGGAPAWRYRVRLVGS